MGMPEPLMEQCSTPTLLESLQTLFQGDKSPPCLFEIGREALFGDIKIADASLLESIDTEGAVMEALNRTNDTYESLGVALIGVAILTTQLDMPEHSRTTINSFVEALMTQLSYRQS